MDRRQWRELLGDDYYDWLFQHNPPEQLEQSLASRGLDVRCEDPATLTAAAKIVVAARPV